MGFSSLSTMSGTSTIAHRELGLHDTPPDDECRLRVIFNRGSELCRPAHFRFTLKADIAAHCSDSRAPILFVGNRKCEGSKCSSTEGIQPPELRVQSDWPGAPC